MVWWGPVGNIRHRPGGVLEGRLERGHARLDRPLLRLCHGALPLAPLVIRKGQDQVTAAAAILAGFTAAAQPKYINLMAEAGPAGRLDEIAVG